MASEKVGRYVIKSELGHGGMATVYAAHDPLTDRDVAIKILPADLLHNPTFRARFDREAKTLAAIDHPAIVPIYDFGEAEGQPYFVMRLMAGGSLADRLKKGPLPVAEAARIFTRIAPALDKAHSLGLIHRDLKPDNILYDQDDQPYLSDFGLVKLSDPGATLTGNMIVGTPAYMAPEQARGEQAITGRCDIYTLGAILFEMLTGKVPYAATTPARQLLKHITEPVPNILAVKTDLPAGCQAIIERAMAKRPEDRYATVTEMATALANVSVRPAPPINLPLPARMAPSAATIIGDAPVQGQATLMTEPYRGEFRPTRDIPPYAPPAYGPPVIPEVIPPVEPAAQRKIPIWVWIAGVLVLGCLALTVIGGGAAAFIFTKPTATRTPTPTFPPTLVPTETPRPTQTLTPSPSPRPTFTPTLPPSETPLPTQTSVPTLPAALLAVFPKAQILDTEEFIQKNANEWIFNDTTTQLVNGVLEITGPKSWNPALLKKEVVKDGEGILVFFKYDPATKMELYLQNGKGYGSAEYRRWGMYGGDLFGLDIYEGAKGVQDKFKGEQKTEPDQWYYALLTVNGLRTFQIQVWKKDSLTAMSSYAKTFTAKWDKQVWSFTMAVYQGKASVESITLVKLAGK